MVTMLLAPDGRMRAGSAKVFEDSAATMEQSIRALREWIATDSLEVVEDLPDEGRIKVRMPCRCCVMSVSVS